MSTPISTTYFVMSLLSLLGLYGLFESVSYGLKSIIYWTRIFTLIYGVVVVVLGLLIFIIELQQLPTSTETKWSAMSQY